MSAPPAGPPQAEQKKIRIMVVDDSNVIRHCARTFLVAAGYEVLMAENGFDALTQVADRRPDLILLDAIMPRLDGYRTCSLIKSNDKYRNIPIIMLSAKDSLFDRVRGRLAGANDYVTKPFCREVLLRAVATRLQAVAAHRGPFARNAGQLSHIDVALA